MSLPAQIKTKRLLLRRPKLADASNIFAKYASDPKVTRYLIWKPHKNIRTVSSFLKKTIKDRKSGDNSYVIIDRATGELIGMIAARVVSHKAEVGYVLARPFWGKGYATEATKALVKALFGQKSISRVWATCDIENKASAKVLKKAGMRFEGTLKRWHVYPNISKNARDSFCFAKTR